MPIQKNQLVIYHADCHDGIASAWVASLVFGDDADYHAGRYGEQIPDAKDKDVYILDFSYSREQYRKILDEAKSVILIDHHASAAERLADMPGTSFDMNHSGCVLAWKYFFPALPVPQTLAYIEDYDLRTERYEDTCAFIFNIKSYPQNHRSWDPFLRLEGDALQGFISEGKAIERYHMTEAQQAIKYGARPFLFDKRQGFAINASRAFADTVAAIILKENADTFVMIWRADEHGSIACSVRSSGKCSARVIAERFGGGGHCHASMFSVGSLREFCEAFPEIACQENSTRCLSCRD